MNLKETNAYIKGLADGLALDPASPEAKVILALIDLTDKMIDEIEALKKKTDTLNDYIEEIDEDLGEVEEYLLDDEDDDEDCCCCHDDDDDDEDEDDEDFMEITCPNCGEAIYFDSDVNYESMVCPACNKHLFEDEEEEECGCCDCGCCGDAE